MRLNCQRRAAGRPARNARAYLHLLWAIATRANADVFAFGTRLTRLTRALQNTNPTWPWSAPRH
jgi:uncharacterized protein with von Willebrand factor type A (vWA) domain